MAGPTRDTTIAMRHRRVALWCVAVVGAMAGLAYASVPLYRLFCQVTGYGGTTQRVSKAPTTVLDRTVTVRFDANVASGLAWTFEPVERKVDVKIGATTLAFYRATNTSSRPLTGLATFNVTPEVAGVYFNKLECFCFKEQRLEPGQSTVMPVSFFVDPAIVSEKDTSWVSQITLSYTFYPVDEAGSPGPAAQMAADRERSRATPSGAATAVLKDNRTTEVTDGGQSRQTP
ncbi:MAG TPA: cytochrome c oxidase assembly protein [Hyphomicrobiaceae bacterium]|nr:cytochrome c oxidase assembly protein [Hyphomicrobiaceae bacterium]